MTRKKPILEAINLRREIDDGSVLLDGVSLSVNPGTSTVIVGPPGAGKTLLLRSLGLLDPVQSGEVHFHGQPIDDHEIPGFRRQVQLVPQRPILIEGTVRENLQLPFSFGPSGEQRFDEPRILDLLSTFDRDDQFLQRKNTDLSGGESQIVALLRALQLNPVVLLLDEPTSSLDARMTEGMEQLIETWKTSAGDRALVVVTHTLEQASRLAHRTIRMEQGRILSETQNVVDPA